MKLPARRTLLRSAELQHPDLALCERFFCQAWGLEIAATNGDTTYFSAQGPDHHCLSVTLGSEPRMLSATLRLETEADLDVVMDHAPRQGGTVESEIAPSDDPAGGVAATVADPQGRRLRFVVGDMCFPDRKPKPDLPIGLTHLNLNASNIERTSKFFEAVLGMQMSDRTDKHVFLCSNDDHHTIVLADNAVNTLNHIAFLMPDLESVMRRSGILRDHGYEIGWGVGRHGPGNNVFAYFESPAGFVVEVTSEILQINEDYRVGGPEDWAWPPGRTDNWGIAPPPLKSLRMAQLSIPFGAARSTESTETDS